MENAAKPKVDERTHVKELDANFGRRVREERERSGMPQSHIALVLKLSYGHQWHQTTVAKVEAGERPVKLAEAVAVSYVLGVPLDQLIDGQNTHVPASKQMALAELTRMEQYLERRRRELTEAKSRQQDR